MIGPVLPNGFRTDKTWETRGLLNTITQRDGVGAVLKSHAYSLNNLRQRATIDREDGAELTLAYDQQRQLTTGERTQVGTRFPEYDYSFSFDEIGNWLTASQSASVATPNATTTSYQANNQNQYTAITAGGSSASPVRNPNYDGNGSVLTDGRLGYQWQERNRLDELTDLATNERSHYRYDAQGRRLEREDYDSTGNLLRTTRYLYQGWNCVAEFEASSSTGLSPAPSAFTRTRTYTWGLDLSQSKQGAGGVGGLCAITDETGAEDLSYHYASDGNGNIVGLYDDTFLAVAEYEYSPFGELIAQNGPYAEENPYRFSTKYQNEYLGGLYYYGYRYYDASTGRWPSRDPIQEEGGYNLYGFVRNGPANEVDALGLYTLGDAKSSLRKRGVKELGFFFGGNAGHVIYTETQIFDEWLRLEELDAGWLNSIPECPDKICIENDEPKDCDNGDWGSLGGAGLHEGAKWCMRSKTFSGSAQQCCYNEKGELRTDLPAAGTPDRVAAGFLGTLGAVVGRGHYGHDVDPYFLSERLGRISDYGAARPSSKGGGSCYKK